MNENRFLIAGVIGALVVPILAFVLHVPFLFAVIAGIAAFGAAAVLLKPRRPFEQLDEDAIIGGQLTAAQAILSQAYEDLNAIEITAKRVGDTAMRDSLKRLVSEGREAAIDIESNPARLSSVRRLLTYYVPRTRDIAANYAEVAARSVVRPEQQRRMQEALSHLEDTYSHYRQESVSTEADALDVELDLLGRSIKQDLEKI